MPATITCHGVPGTDTVTATLFPDGSDTSAASGLTFTRATNRKGTGSFSTSVTGIHKIELRDDSANLRWYGWAVVPASGSIEASDTRQESILQTAMEPEGLVHRFTANALEESPSGGGGGDCPTAEEIAAAVEDVLTGIDITVSATSLVDGEPLRITKGDDYESSATPSTAIVMTLTGTGLHSTTGDTWKLWLNTPGADPVETTAVATSSATNSLTLTFELTKTQTDTLTTIAGGTWTVRQVTATTAYKSAKKSGRLIVIPNPETERAA